MHLRPKLLRLIGAAMVLCLALPLGAIHEPVASQESSDGQCGPEGDRGLIVYLQQVSGPGTPEPERWQLVVITPEGTELHRVDLAEFVFPVPFSLFAGCKVLMEGEASVSLFDAAKGVLHELTLPEDLDDVAVRPDWGTASHWALISDYHGRRALLLDLDTREIIDLAAITGDVVVQDVQLSDNGDYVLLAGDWQLWLIPTANPEEARTLGRTTGFQAGDFSPDGERIIYTEWVETQEGMSEYRVVVETIDGPQSDVVAVGDVELYGQFVPSQNAVILTRPDRLSILSLDDRFERDLLMLPTGESATLHFSPTGRHLLVKEPLAGPSPNNWYLIDLQTSSSTRLDELTGKLSLTFPMHTPRFSPRWWLFSDFFTDPFTHWGGVLLGLDMETGNIHRLLEEDENTSYGIPRASLDGRLVVVSTINGESVRLELFDLERGASRLLTPDRGGGAVSPDGRSVAVVSAKQGSSGLESQLLILDMESGGDVLIGTGKFPILLWLG